METGQEHTATDGTPESDGIDRDPRFVRLSSGFPIWRKVTA